MREVAGAVVAGGMRRALLAGDVGDDAFEGAAGGGVAFLGDSAGLVGEAAGLQGVAHGVGHFYGVFGVGDAGVEEDAVGAELHGDGDVTRRADAGIDDDGVGGVVLFQGF